MTFKTTLKGVALAGVCLAPFAAAAQSNTDATAAAGKAAPYLSNEVTLGAEWQSGKAAQFGKYTGQWAGGGEVVGGFHVKGGDAWNSGGTTYWEAFGNNIDANKATALPEASLGFKYGQQGKWGIKFGYDSITYFQSDSFRSVYDKSGNLQPGITAGGTAAWRADLLAPLMPSQDLKTRRDIFTGGGKIDLGNGLLFSVDNKYEHKEGTQQQSMTVGGTATPVAAGVYTGLTSAGISAGNPPANLVYFPQPINYDTNRFDATLAYTTKKMQASLGYTFSSFTDNNIAFTGWDPFRDSGGVAGQNTLGVVTAGATPAALAANGYAATGLPIQTSYSLPPSNSEHRVTGKFAYDFGSRTRLSSTFAYGIQYQNASLAAATLNQNLLNNNTFNGALINGQQMNASAHNLNGNVVLTSRPIKDVDLRASYTISDYDNNTPRDQVNATYADTALTGACILALNCGHASGVTINRYSFTKQKVAAEAGYNVLPETKVSIGDTLQFINRKYDDFERSTENTMFARIASANLVPGINGTASYEHAVRAANITGWNYGSVNIQNGNGVPTETLPNSVSLGIPSNPGGPYWNASRTADTVKGNLQYSPGDGKFTVGLNGQYTHDNYPQSNGEGLDSDYRATIGPDVTFAPNSALGLHLFYTFERAWYRNNGMYTQGQLINNATLVSPAAAWNQTTSDDTHTLGFNAEWKAIKDVLNIGLDYNFSYGNISLAESDSFTAAFLGRLAGTGSATVQNYTYAAIYGYLPVPDLRSNLNSVALHAEYFFTPAVSLWGGYMYERLNYSNYADNYAVAQYANVLFPGTSNPSYNIHAVGTSMRVKF